MYKIIVQIVVTPVLKLMNYNTNLFLFMCYFSMGENPA